MRSGGDSARACAKPYAVKAGDTLEDIAKRHNRACGTKLTAKDIALHNELPEIAPGSGSYSFHEKDRLTFPQPAQALPPIARTACSRPWDGIFNPGDRVVIRAVVVGSEEYKNVVGTIVSRPGEGCNFKNGARDDQYIVEIDGTAKGTPDKSAYNPKGAVTHTFYSSEIGVSPQNLQLAPKDPSAIDGIQAYCSWL